MASRVLKSQATDLGVDMQTSQERETMLSDAYELGCIHACGAASWITDGNTDRDAARKLLAMMADGDPASEDYLPRRPDLSGEWADDMTPIGLCQTLGVATTATQDDMLEVCEEYERGVEDTFEQACESALIAFLG